MGRDPTPESKISAELALKAYQCVTDQGRLDAGAYEYDGIRALLDHDGYGVTLTDGTVSVRILFHNRVAIDTPNTRSLMRFRKHLVNMVQKAL